MAWHGLGQELGSQAHMYALCPALPVVMVCLRCPSSTHAPCPSFRCVSLRLGLGKQALTVHELRTPPSPPLRCVSLRLGLGEQAPAVHELRKLLGGDFARWGRSVDVHFWCRHKKHDSSRAVHNASKTAVHHASKAVHESGKMALI